jgi:hypothetical protein
MESYMSSGLAILEACVILAETQAGTCDLKRITGGEAEAG